LLLADGAREEEVHTIYPFNVDVFNASESDWKPDDYDFPKSILTLLMERYAPSKQYSYLVDFVTNP
jgi:hypothetical protein